MRRAIIAAALAIFFLVVTALPAFAAIHPIASLECAAGPSDSVANTQDPPGQLMLGAIAPNTAIPASNGAALNGDSGVAHCLNA
jgi:hypothetical protein